jgi:copper(I)-binding protein
MEVSEAWARPAAQDGNGAIYFVIQNYEPQADELTGVSCDVAEAAEMHESKVEGDVMQMRQLGSIPLPAGAAVTFEPGGLHIMLIRLKHDLKPGDEVEVTLHFENSEDLRILVTVQETEAP